MKKAGRDRIGFEMAAQDNAKHGKIEKKQQQIVRISSVNLSLHNHGVKRNGEASREGVGSKSRNVSRRSHSWGPSLTSVLMNGIRTKLPTRNTSKYQVMQKSQRQQPRNQRPHKSQAHGPEANPITVRYSTAARNKLTPIPHRRIQTLTDKAERTPKSHSE